MLFDCKHCGAHLFRPHHEGCPGRLEPTRDVCVFCGNRPEDVAWMAGEPGRRICDRCIARCQEVLADVASLSVEVPPAPAAPDLGPDTEGTHVPAYGATSATSPAPPSPDVDWYGPPKRDRCGYCGRSRDVAHRLIAGPKVAICDTCVFDIAVQRSGDR